jgi:hypothetical protein
MYEYKYLYYFQRLNFAANLIMDWFFKTAFQLLLMAFCIMTPYYLVICSNISKECAASILVTYLKVAGFSKHWS